MRVELVSPCCLHLGFVCGPGGSVCELVIALQHPPIQLTVQPAPQLLVSGARAGIAYHAAETYYACIGQTPRGQIEVELAIPAFMGLGADKMLSASVAYALCRASRLPEVPATYTSFRLAFQHGGLLLVGERGELLRRAEIVHADEVDDWVFVFVLPQAPDDVPDDLEWQRLVALRDASNYLDPSCTAEALFDAVARDDFDAFCDELSVIHTANRIALHAIRRAAELDEQERDVIACMLANGAKFAGRALTGLGLVGLIKGGPASRALRQALVRRLGYFGPRVMATICDNQGVRVMTDD